MDFYLNILKTQIYIIPVKLIGAFYVIKITSGEIVCTAKDRGSILPESYTNGQYLLLCVLCVSSRVVNLFNKIEEIKMKQIKQLKCIQSLEQSYYTFEFSFHFY